MCCKEDWHVRGEQAEGHMSKWYKSICRFPVYSRVIILFVHMWFPSSAMCRLPVCPHFIFLLGHMSSSGSDTCHFLLWPRFFSGCAMCLFHVGPQVHPCVFFVCPCIIFMLDHLLSPGSATCRFPICTLVLYRSDHMVFTYLASCQFTIWNLGTCLFLNEPRVHFLISCTSILDHHMSETWMLHMFIYYMLTFIQTYFITEQPMIRQYYS